MSKTPCARTNFTRGLYVCTTATTTTATATTTTTSTTATTAAVYTPGVPDTWHQYVLYTRYRLQLRSPRHCMPIYYSRYAQRRLVFVLAKNQYIRVQYCGIVLCDAVR